MRLGLVAAEAASSHGYPDIGAFVLARPRAGASLASVSREAGLHEDWMARHLGRVDAAAAELARQHARDRRDAAWLPALRALGYSDVAGYLRDRHLVQHRTVNAIAAEIGLVPPCRRIGNTAAWTDPHRACRETGDG